MKSRSRFGGTLALVAVLILIVVIIGIAFIAWQLLLGGGKELQIGVDSGNLNVAKQVLRRPFITVPDQVDAATGINPRLEFQDVLDPQNVPLNQRNQLNLLNINRVIGKAVLVQLNARAEGTGRAAANAAQLTNTVYQLASQLESAIDDPANLEEHFSDTARRASTRQLETGSKGIVGSDGQAKIIANRATEHQVAFMARQAATNVYFDGPAADGQPPNNLTELNQILPTPLQSQDIVIKRVRSQADGQTRDRIFLTGYLGLSSRGGLAGVPLTYGVPLRPGEQPHLVSVEDFGRSTSPPFTPATGQVVPNAYRSGGEAQHSNAPANLLSQARSCAVVGVLDQIFPITIPGGTIIVDNQACLADLGTQTFTTAPTNSLFGVDPPGPLMNPNGVEVFKIRINNGSWPTGGVEQGPSATGSPIPNVTNGKVSSNEARFMCAFSEGEPLPSTRIPQLSTQDSGTSPTGTILDNVRTFPQNTTLSGVEGGLYFWALTQKNQPRYVSRFSSRRIVMQGPGAAGDPGGGYGASLGGTVTQVTESQVCNNLDFNGSSNICSDNASAFTALLSGIVGPVGSVDFSELMLLESYILTIRQGFTGAGGGCISVPALAPIGQCATSPNFMSAGLKNIDPAEGSPIPFADRDPSLRDLFEDTATSQAVQDDIDRRIRQIFPGARLANVVNQDVPFNTIRFIRSGPNGLVMDGTQPATLLYNYATQDCRTRPIISAPLNIPDGNQVRSPGVQLRVSERWVPFFMWECGSGQADGQSHSLSHWFPSSGKGGLLGIIRFFNCPEAGGPDWCCP